MIVRSTLMLVAVALPMFPNLFAQQSQTRPVLQAAPVAQAPSVPAVAAPSAMQAGSIILPSSYVISTGDVLQLTVWKEPGMSNPSIPVRPDGMISLSLVGDIPAAGLTPMQLGSDVASRLKKYMNDPLVTVTVLGVQPKEVYLLGEIGHIGPVAITPGMTPLQAIAAAGGLSSFAKAKHIYILRKGNEKQIKIAFDYKKAIKDGDMQGVTLIPGDTIVVP